MEMVLVLGELVFVFFGLGLGSLVRLSRLVKAGMEAPWNENWSEDGRQYLEQRESCRWCSISAKAPFEPNRREPADEIGPLRSQPRALYLIKWTEPHATIRPDLISERVFVHGDAHAQGDDREKETGWSDVGNFLKLHNTFPPEFKARAGEKDYWRSVEFCLVSEEFNLPESEAPACCSR